MKKYDQTFIIPFTTYTGRTGSMMVEADSESEAIEFTRKHPSVYSVTTSEGATIWKVKQR